MIDVVVLAAGYGTRLEREILADTSGKFDKLRNLPKPLIPLGGKPLLDYWIEDLKRCSEWISNIYIVSNDHFYHQFEKWAHARSFPVKNIINDGTSANDRRLGAVADLLLGIEERKNTKSDLLVIAGDTLFLAEFDLRQFISQYHKLESGSLIPYYSLKNHAEVAKRGIIELDDKSRVIGFREKPKPEETKSNKAVPPLYLFSKEVLPLVHAFVNDETTTRDERDAPGMFLAWLYKRHPVHATAVSGRFDVGGLVDYVEANEYFSQLNAQAKESSNNL